MKQKFLKSLTLFSLVYSSVSVGENLLIGDYQAKINIPSGFTLITEGPLFERFKIWEQPELKHLAYLLDSNELEMVQRGIKDSFDRQHTFAIVKELRNVTVTRQQFNVLKSRMIEQKIPGMKTRL